jgi:hypothetical protein
MQPSKRVDASDGAAKGLVTVAMLKAQLGVRGDYLEMFAPFAKDVIWSRGPDEFRIADLRREMIDAYGLSIPIGVLQKIAIRLARQGIVDDEGGRFIRNNDKLRTPTLHTDRQNATRQMNALADALVAFAETKGVSIATPDEGLSWLLAFLREHQVDILLGEGDDLIEQSTLRASSLSPAETRVVAGFIKFVSEREPRLAEYLQTVIEGFVLQSALFLKEVRTERKSFGRLAVYLDTGFLISALGFEGKPQELAAGELIELLHQTGAETRVFEPTVAEIRRILAAHEALIGTADGRERLRPTEMARYFLSKRFSPADIRQQSALVERRLREIGVPVTQMPRRKRESTWDERKLTLALKKPNETENEPRIVHDVDCVAAIMTLRRGRTTTGLDDARAVFATTSRGVLETVKQWYTEDGGHGMPPIVHVRTLSNSAWLKRPASGSRLKLHEVVALCAAALKPSRETWDEFLRYLRELEESGELSNDEAVAIVVSELTDRELARVEDDGFVEAESLAEVVTRVKQSYREEADLEIAAERDRTIRVQTELYDVHDKVQQRVGEVASVISMVVIGFLLLLVIAGLIMQLPWSSHVVSARIHWTITVAALGALLGLTAVNMITGANLLGIQRRLRDKLHQVISEWFIGRLPPDEETS